MFEQRRVLKALYELASRRARAQSIRVLPNSERVERVAKIALLRPAIAVAVAVACTLLPSPIALGAAGVFGLAALGLRWNRFVIDMLPAPLALHLYPVSAEVLWRTRYESALRASLWFVLDASAVITAFAINGQISISAALASLPSALAFSAWMTALPMLLTWIFRGFRPVRLGSAVLAISIGGYVVAQSSPAYFSIVIQCLGWVARLTPAGWFYLLVTGKFDLFERVIMGVVMSAMGLAIIRVVAARLEQEITRRDEALDAAASVAYFSEATGENDEDAPDLEEVPETTSAGHARALLEEQSWGSFAEPQTFSEKLFWRTLNARQRLAAKVIWPFGFPWARARFHWLASGACIAIAAALRLLGFTQVAWFVIGYGVLALFLLAPILPGYSFVFQPLYLGGRSAARCQFWPVSIAEISSILSRCQSIRAVGALWVGAAFGALTGLAMGLPVLRTALSGVEVIFLSYAAHPFALILKLSSLMGNSGRRWMMFPYSLVMLCAAILAVVGTFFAFGITLMSALNEAHVRSLLIAMFLSTSVLRLAGWIFLKLTLLFMERSWLDAVVKTVKGKVVF